MTINDSLIEDYKNKAYALKQSNSHEATRLLRAGLSLAKSEKNLVDIGYFYRQLVAQKGVNAKLDSANYWVNQGIAFYKTVKDQTSEPALDAHLYSELAEVYRRNDTIAKALALYQKAEEIYQEKEDGFGVLISNINIGNIHYAKSEYTKALERYLIAKPYSDTTKHLYIKGGNYNSLSAVYNALGDTVSGMKYAKKFVKAMIPETNPTYKAYAYLGLGENYLKLELYETALKKLDSAAFFVAQGNLVGMQKNLSTAKAKAYLALNRPKDAVALLEKDKSLIEDYKTNTEDNFNFKFQLGKAYMALNQNDKALAELLPLKTQAARLGFINEEGYITSALSSIYKRKNDFKNAFLYQEKAMKIQDSIFGIEKQKSFKEIDTKYKAAEKEKALAETRANLAEKEIEVNRKNTLMYGGFGLAIILGLIGFLIYSQQKLKNKQLKKESELKTALARIETQNKLQEQRLRISRDLHDNIGSQLAFIISSIDTLKFGMKEKTGKVADKLSLLSDFTTTTVYELRDTIWAMNKTEITLEDLQSRIANFIEKAGIATDTISFYFDISDKINQDTVFTSVKGMNCYRIIQEAVNNAIKHAKATKIEVTIQPVHSSSIKVSIVDNGIGLQEDAVTLHNGITNMKKRAKDLESELQIVANKTNGTTISFYIDQ